MFIFKDLTQRFQIHRLIFNPEGDGYDPFGVEESVFEFFKNREYDKQGNGDNGCFYNKTSTNGLTNNCHGPDRRRGG